MGARVPLLPKRARKEALCPALIGMGGRPAKLRQTHPGDPNPTPAQPGWRFDILAEPAGFFSSATSNTIPGFKWLGSGGGDWYGRNRTNLGTVRLGTCVVHTATHVQVFPQLELLGSFFDRHLSGTTGATQYYSLSNASRYNGCSGLHCVRPEVRPASVPKSSVGSVLSFVWGDSSSSSSSPPGASEWSNDVRMRLTQIWKNLVKTSLLPTSRYLTRRPSRSSRLFTSLLKSVKKILDCRQVFGPSVLPTAINIMATFVHNEPTCLNVIREVGLPDSFYKAIESGLEPVIEVIQSVPHALGALCLNQTGIDQLTTGPTIIPSFFSISTSERHQRMLQEKEERGAYRYVHRRAYPSSSPPPLKDTVFASIKMALAKIEELGNAFEIPDGLKQWYFLQPSTPAPAAAATTADNDVVIEETPSGEGEKANLEKNPNEAFRKLITLHIRTMLLSDIYATAGYQARAMTTLLQHLVGSDVKGILLDLAALHRVFVWDNIVLKSDPEFSTVDVPIHSETWTPLKHPVLTPGMATLSQSEMEVPTPTTDGAAPSGSAEGATTPKEDGPVQTNIRALKYVANQIPNALTGFFQYYLDAADAISEIILQHLKEKSSSDKLSLFAYYTVMLGMIGVLLFEDRGTQTSIPTVVLAAVYFILARPVGPDENRIRQLMDMGFLRSAAEHALVCARNNVNTAAELLLAHPSPFPPDPEAKEPAAVPEPVAGVAEAPAETSSEVAPAAAEGQAASTEGTEAASAETAEASSSNTEDTQPAPEPPVLCEKRSRTASAILVDEHLSLAFDIQRVFVGPNTGYCNQSIRNLLDDIKSFSPSAYEHQEHPITPRIYACLRGVAIVGRRASYGEHSKGRLAGGQELESGLLYPEARNALVDLSCNEFAKRNGVERIFRCVKEKPSEPSAQGEDAEELIKTVKREQSP
ncbi:DUF913-domain-containing protein [Panus rudis PR-1116 ss-1]|nr:DUF913-domain-containing protein [Panus rudis PR-1116 ss-1]